MIAAFLLIGRVWTCVLFAFHLTIALIKARYHLMELVDSCGVGDEVLIEETRPLSKTKRWRVKEIVQKAVNV